MAEKQITITQKDFDDAYEHAVDVLSGALVDSHASGSRAMMSLMVAATVSAHIKHILFREGEADSGNQDV